MGSGAGDNLTIASGKHSDSCAYTSPYKRSLNMIIFITISLTHYRCFLHENVQHTSIDLRLSGEAGAEI